MDKDKQNEALHKAGVILIEAFPDFYGSIKFNLQGRRKSVHSNIIHELGLEISQNQQFLENSNK